MRGRLGKVFRSNAGINNRNDNARISRGYVPRIFHMNATEGTAACLTCFSCRIPLQTVVEVPLKTIYRVIGNKRSVGNIVRLREFYERIVGKDSYRVLHCPSFGKF